MKAFQEERKRKTRFSDGDAEPKLAILDETDSGLDIDALRIVANGVNKLKSPEKSTILITHIKGCWNILCLIMYMCCMMVR